MEFCQAWLCQDPNDACYDATYDHNDDDIINFEDFAYFAEVWDIPSTSSRESDFYYLHDALGSVIGLVGGRFQRESDREFYLYDVYGATEEQSACGNPYLFTGGRFDILADSFLKSQPDSRVSNWEGANGSQGVFEKSWADVCCYSDGWMR